MSDIENTKRWEGLVRASVLNATTGKLYDYISLADRKAMALIILNSALIPFAMNGLGNDIFKVTSTIAIITGVISIFMAIICVFPKRSRGHKPDGSLNLLHFSDIGAMKEQEYLELMRPIYNDRSALSVEVLKDIHDVSRRVLIPKFKLLKISYVVFFIGNLIAVIEFLINIWL
jgi:hypothetical protein